MAEPEDGEPRWLLIRLGPLTGCTAIPVEPAAEAAERLWAAYDRDSIHAAPRFRPDEALSAEQELELAAHWGIGAERGRAAEVAEHEAHEITAVPAEGGGLAQQPNWRAITICCTSSVPSPMVRILASR
jgi:hypothetical protein